MMVAACILSDLRNHSIWLVISRRIASRSLLSNIPEGILPVTFACNMVY